MSGLQATILQLLWVQSQQSVLWFWKCLCTCEIRVNSKGDLAIVDIEHVLDPVSGSALASVSPAQQTEGFDIGGGGLNVTAGAKHGCREIQDSTASRNRLQNALKSWFDLLLILAK